MTECSILTGLYFSSNIRPFSHIQGLCLKLSGKFCFSNIEFFGGFLQCFSKFEFHIFWRIAMETSEEHLISFQFYLLFKAFCYVLFSLTFSHLNRNLDEMFTLTMLILLWFLNFIIAKSIGSLNLHLYLDSFILKLFTTFPKKLLKMIFPILHHQP